MYEDFTQEPKGKRAQKKRKARARKVEADRKPVRDAPRGMPLWRKIVLGAIFVFAAFSVLIMSAVINSADDYSPQEQIEYSDFYKKDGEIYALVVGADYFAIPGADAASFRVLNFGSGYRSNVAADKNAVYCGNIAMSELEPARTKAVAFGYVSDGRIGYFCDGEAVPNDALGALKLTYQTLAHIFWDAPKPQSYLYYKFKRMDATDLRQIVGLYYAAEGSRAFYKGEVLAGADAANLQAIKGSDGRASSVYTADSANVYFKNLRLDARDNGGHYELLRQRLSYFLWDVKSGDVFANDLKFDPAAAPYTPLNRQLAHSNHLFFTSPDGIYYFDENDGKQKRAADNPFAGEVHALSGSVFQSGERIYFLERADVWGGGRSTRRLVARKSGLFALELPHEWRRVGGVHGGLYGWVYSNGGRFFYFDDLGSSQLIDRCIYEIRDLSLVEILLQKSSFGTSKIREMIKSGGLEAVDGELLFEVKTRVEF
nr:DKNYY domain-containing protein [uncultured Campylobacter sp.]